MAAIVQDDRSRHNAHVVDESFHRGKRRTAMACAMCGRRAEISETWAHLHVFAPVSFLGRNAALTQCTLLYARRHHLRNSRSCFGSAGDFAELRIANTNAQRSRRSLVGPAIVGQREAAW
jgi:hypothetical protein